MNEEKTFWMLWSPHGSAPTKKHETLAEAREEAERLMGLHPGRTFYVLQAVSRCRVKNVEWSDLSAA